MSHLRIHNAAAPGPDTPPNPAGATPTTAKVSGLVFQQIVTACCRAAFWSILRTFAYAPAERML